MSNKQFKSLRYTKDKPLEFTVGIPAAEAEQDNVGDDKAKLVITSDRRLFLNGEEICKPRPVRPAPIVNKAIPLRPMVGSRYVLRRSKRPKDEIEIVSPHDKFRLQFVVLKNAPFDDDTIVDLNGLYASLQTVFVGKISLGCLYGYGSYYFLKTPLDSTLMNFCANDISHDYNTKAEIMTFVAEFLIDIPDLDSDFFVIRVKKYDGKILTNPEFEAELCYKQNDERYNYEVRIKDEACASPDYAIMNGKLFCVKMPNVQDSFGFIKGVENVDFMCAKNYNNAYQFISFRNYREARPTFHIREKIFYKKNGWNRITSEHGFYNQNHSVRLYPVKKHGTCKEQSIHFVEYRAIYNANAMRLQKNGTH